jgi:hypothetical protein
MNSIQVIKNPALVSSSGVFRVGRSRFFSVAKEDVENQVKEGTL